MKIQDYLMKHEIIRIGTTLPGYVCCEIIVDNPEELIIAVEKNDCYISEILWWEYTALSSTPVIGHGGALDPRNPDRYFFAETDLCKRFSEYVSCEEYLAYLAQTKAMYSNLILFPSFDIKKCVVATNL